MNGRALGAVLLGCVVVSGCGAGSPSAPSGTSSAASTSAAPSGSSTPSDSPASSASQPPQTTGALFLVGQQTATGAAAGLLGGFETRINATPGPNDTVLFTVSAEDGPMPQTREQIEALKGRAYGPSAILLVRSDRVTDPELRALVIQETRDLLQRNSVPRALEIPVLLAEDPNIALLIRGLRSPG